MRIDVRLSGFLKRAGLPGGFTGGSLEAPEGFTVEDVLAQIGVTRRTPWLITHNGELAQFSTVLQDGDIIIIVQPISGGV